MAYTELIKNFERVREYMRDFYVYGFKGRGDFDKKSNRSYDNERRRIESYLLDYISSRQTTAGKNVFLSFDSRNLESNPLYKAFKSNSFTDGDITLHFIIFDILWMPDIALSIPEITSRIDEYLSHFESPLIFDESTVRKKLKEYIDLGLIETEKQGKQLLYKRTESFNISSWNNAIAFFSEIGLDGVIGSYLLDKVPDKNHLFSFKHHYITHVMDSEILCRLLEAIADRKIVTIQTYIHNTQSKKSWDVVPLKIYLSVQSGRQYIMSYNIRQHKITSTRIDYITNVDSGDTAQSFDKLQSRLAEMQIHMWGVSCNKSHNNLEHVEFTVNIQDDEQYIFTRLQREKRCGTVERIDKNTIKFSADVFDSWELVPWIRTFICRITEMNFSNRTVENQFKKDIESMYSMYEISKGAEI